MNAPATLAPPDSETARAPAVPAGGDAIDPRFPAGAFPRPLSLAEFHAMLNAGVFPNDGQRIELLDGFLSEKPVPEPLHSGTVRRIDKRLRQLLPEGWEVRQQDAVTLSNSEPLPDIAVVPDRDDVWFTRHPTAEECAVVIEVSDSTLRADRTRKARIYAAAGVSPYWIVNLVDRRVEVHDDPSPGDGTEENPPGYRRRDALPGETLAFAVGDATVTLDAGDLLPPDDAR